MSEEPKKGRLTLYEDLLSAETLAERKAKEAAAQVEEIKKKSNASLMFKPTNLGKKPTNTKNQTPKAKPSFASIPKLSSNSTSSTVISAPPTIYATTSSPNPPTQQSSIQPPPQSEGKQGQKRGFNDWLADEDEEWHYYERPRQERGGKKKRKNKNKQGPEQIWSWDDIYDPTVPVNFLEYPKSDAQYDMNDAWKRRLYSANKRERQRQQSKTTSLERSDVGDKSRNRHTPNMNFAPPSGLNFAPPPDYVSNGMLRPNSPTRPLPALGHSSTAHSSSDVRMRENEENDVPQRMASSEATKLQPAAPVASVSPTPFSSAAQKPVAGEAAEKAAKAAAQIAALKAKIAAAKPTQSSTTQNVSHSENVSPVPPIATAPRLPSPPQIPEQTLTAEPPIVASGGTVSAAPTFNPEYYARKEHQDVSVDGEPGLADAAGDPEEPRSNRPGQAGFAERMLKKMGWEKGQGLGKTGDGITTAIVAKAEKRKKLPDAVGGGFAVPANMGKIVGGKKKKAAKEPGDSAAEGDDVFGSMSEVIKLEGMLKGMDVDLEIRDNNLLQEIGEEMGQFGTVERLFIWREHAGGTNDVFVKFTSQLSALRAVKAMDGEEFAENIIKARFWDSDKFENGNYA